MGAAKKETGAETGAENEVFKMKNIGNCLVRVAGVDVVPGASFELTADQLNSQGIKSLVYGKYVEFEDDPAKTREYIADVVKAAKPKQQEDKTIEQLENGKTIK